LKFQFGVSKSLKELNTSGLIDDIFLDLFFFFSPIFTDSIKLLLDDLTFTEV